VVVDIDLRAAVVDITLQAEVVAEVLVLLPEEEVEDQEAVTADKKINN
jgi:hypothetical protein